MAGPSRSQPSSREPAASSFERARVHQAPAPDVAVVGGFQLDCALRLAHGARDVIGMTQRRGADLPFQAGIAHELGRGLLAETERVVVRRGAGNDAPARLDLARNPAVDEHQLAARAQLEGEAARAGGARKLHRRRRPGVGEHDRGGALQPHVPAAHRHDGVCRPAFVVGKDGGKRAALARTHAVETRRHAVAEAKVAQHRRHPPDGREQRGVRRLGARGVASAQRQQVEQQLHENPWIAADVAAVGRDLALQLRRQELLRLRQAAIVAVDAQMGVNEADQGDETRAAVGRILPGGGEIRDLIGQAAHDGGVALGLRAIEQQGRVRQPGEDAAAHDLRLPGELRRAVAALDPFADELAGDPPVLAGRRPVEVPEPAEAVQLACPGRLGGGIANGERPRRSATAPASPKLPAATSSAKLASWARRSGGASSSSSAAGER